MAPILQASLRSQIYRRRTQEQLLQVHVKHKQRSRIIFLATCIQLPREETQPWTRAGMYTRRTSLPEEETDGTETKASHGVLRRSLQEQAVLSSLYQSISTRQLISDAQRERLKETYECCKSLCTQTQASNQIIQEHKQVKRSGRYAGATCRGRYPTVRRAQNGYCLA